MRAPAVLAGAAAVMALAGCVTERADAPGGSRNPIFDRPIARPVLGGTDVSRIVVALSGLGTIPYDGVTLPLISPDGRSAATQLPPAAPRSLRIGAPGADGDASSSVAIIELGPDGVQQEVFDANAPILLGRDADTLGFLVESPRPDGSRWIGRASWTGGGITWIERGPAVHAHAVLGPAGSVLYGERPVGDGRFELVRRDRDGTKRALRLPGADLVYPLMAPDGRHATCLAVRPDSIQIVLIDLSASSDRSLGRIVRRFDLSGRGSLAGAEQIVAASASGASAGEALGPMVFHPATKRVVAVNAARRTLVSLAPNGVAAVGAGGGRALCATPDGLVLWTPTGQNAGRASRVLAEDYIPRRTASVDRPYVLLSPLPTSPTDFRVFAMKPATPDE
ncbi:MAG: hypothetical protein AAFX79_05460 [Planctomycetota bacterium]